MVLHPGDAIMKKINLYNALYLFSILAMIFTISLHTAKANEVIAKREFTVSVALEKKYGTPLAGKRAHIDGKYEITVLESTDDLLIFSCSGRVCENGYFIDGGKYISKNQPVFIKSEVGGCEGRIVNIK
jgi:hypothetical protein